MLLLLTEAFIFSTQSLWIVIIIGYFVFLIPRKNENKTPSTKVIVKNGHQFSCTCT